MTDHERATPRPLHEAGDLIELVTGGRSTGWDESEERIETFRIVRSHVFETPAGYTATFDLERDPDSSPRFRAALSEPSS